LPESFTRIVASEQSPSCFRQFRYFEQQEASLTPGITSDNYSGAQPTIARLKSSLLSLMLRIVTDCANGCSYLGSEDFGPPCTAHTRNNQQQEASAASSVSGDPIWNASDYSDLVQHPNEMLSLVPGSFLRKQ
jgi:hypothetical protein